jgi:opacity protein-like surface antigen
MKNQQALLVFVLSLFITTSVLAQKPSLSASVIMGISPPKQGLEYKAGFGVKGGAHLGHLYAGAALFAHTGDELSLRYGSASGLGINGGRQNYKWAPKFLMADIGYEVKIKFGTSFSSSFMPYFSTGLVSIKVSSSGVYGSPDDLKINKLGLGGGFSYTVAIVKNLSVGLEYRIYPLGRIHADFGNASQRRIVHGFHTDGYYDAIFAVASYCF